MTTRCRISLRVNIDLPSWCLEPGSFVIPAHHPRPGVAVVRNLPSVARNHTHRDHPGSAAPWRRGHKRGTLEPVFERFTDRSRRVLVLAQEESRLLNHGFIGTEHILLGLLNEHDGVAAQALKQLGVSLEVVREKVEQVVGVSPIVPTGSPPFTPRAKKVLELSLREALQLHHNYIGTEHLLLGLVREGEGVGAQVLVGLGVELARVRQQVTQLFSDYPNDEVVGADPGSSRYQNIIARVPRGRWMSSASATLSAGGGAVGRGVCSFCRRDLWEVGRHVSAGAVAICEDCVATATVALEHGEVAPGGEVVFPPRLFGAAPDENALDAVVSAIRTAFGVRPGESGTPRPIEGAEDLEAYFAEAGRRVSVRAAGTRVERVRFLGDDVAEVEFVISLTSGGVFPFGGRVVRSGNRWLVSRQTVVRVLQRAGVTVPDGPAGQ